MNVIKVDERLEKYFLAFKKLFVLLFQASHFLMENMFRLTEEIFENKQIRVVCLLY